jgi:hypothetical protein
MSRPGPAGTGLGREWRAYKAACERRLPAPLARLVASPTFDRLVLLYTAYTLLVVAIVGTAVVAFPDAARQLLELLGASGAMPTGVDAPAEAAAASLIES